MPCMPHINRGTGAMVPQLNTVPHVVTAAGFSLPIQVNPNNQKQPRSVHELTTLQQRLISQVRRLFICRFYYLIILIGETTSAFKTEQFMIHINGSAKKAIVHCMMLLRLVIGKDSFIFPAVYVIGYRRFRKN